MTRSHPPSLLTIVRRDIVKDALFGRGDLVLAAVSGGPDSMALLHVLARLRGKIGHRLAAHGVDHGLRPEAGRELDSAAGVAASLDVPFTRTVLAVARGANLQARARHARLDALRDAARSVGAAVIATGHTADDRAETVLLRLLRGAGPRGLAVLPPKAGDLVRPLIRATRADVLAHLARHGVPSAEDPSNKDPRFLRVRVRAELVPLLLELSPGIVGHLVAVADQLGELPVDAPGEVAHKVRRALPRASRTALRELAATKSRTRRVLLPGGLVAHYDHAQLGLVVDELGPHTEVARLGGARWKKREFDGTHHRHDRLRSK